MSNNNSKKNTDPLAAVIEKMRAENEALKAQLAAKGNGKLSYKVSEKGALSVYGMGRFPVTLYAEQWEKLLSDEGLPAFLAANKDKFSTKADKVAADAAKAAVPAVGTTAPKSAV